MFRMLARGMTPRQTRIGVEIVYLAFCLFIFGLIVIATTKSDPIPHAAASTAVEG